LLQRSLEHVALLVTEKKTCLSILPSGGFEYVTVTHSNSKELVWTSIAAAAKKILYFSAARLGTLAHVTAGVHVLIQSRGIIN
jgi:hypothetical protein